MSKKKSQNQDNFIFKKENYKIMFVGLALIAVGFILMTGGGSKDPNKFNEALYSFRRIRLAPTLILIGFATEIYAILKNPKK